MIDLTALCREIGETNAANGWHDRYNLLAAAGDEAGIDDHIVAKLGLIGTEVAEAIEEVRTGHLDAYYSLHGRRVTPAPDGTVAGIRVPLKPEGLPSELADIVIRTIDLAHTLGIDLPSAIVEKVAANRHRGHMHGGKRL